MSEKRLPYYRKQVECPLCRNITNNFALKSKIYIPKKIDTDSYVLVYHWLDKEHTQCEPSFYALWTCTNCGYSDFPSYFDTYLNDEASLLTSFKEAVLKSSQDDKGIIQTLLAHIHLKDETIDFETAMNMHLLAIYDHDVLFPDNADYEKLGRLYLRHAWLFRDYKRLHLKDRNYAGFGTYWEFIQSLKSQWPTIPLDEGKSIRKAAENFSKIIFQDFTYDEAVKNIKFVLLSSELYLRLNDYKNAFDVVHSIIKLGYSVRREIHHAITEKKKRNELPPDEERRAMRRIDKITTQLYDVHERYVLIKERWVEIYADLIENIIADNPNAQSDILLAKLIEAKIPQDVVDIIQRDDERFQTQGDKKHFWNFWK